MCAGCACICVRIRVLYVHRGTNCAASARVPLCPCAVRACRRRKRERERKGKGARVVSLCACPYRLVTPLVSSVTRFTRSLAPRLLLTGLVRSVARSLVHSLAHSSFQFASESKGLIKTPQTGFSGISRVNAKESQTDSAPCTTSIGLLPIALYYHRHRNVTLVIPSTAAVPRGTTAAVTITLATSASDTDYFLSRSQPLPSDTGVHARREHAAP